MEEEPEKEQKKDEERKEELPEEDEEIKKHIEKKQRKIFLTMVVVIIISLAILFSIRFFFGDEKYPEYTYNGFTFRKIAGLWHTEWQLEDKVYSIHLRYGPRESEDVPVYTTEEYVELNPSRTTYLTSDPGYNKAYVALASSEIALNLANTFGVIPIGACTENGTYPACSTRPIVTCDNTEDSEAAVIYIKEDDENKIIVDGNCLTIQGRGEDIVKAADKVIWLWYGIIRE
tara:strand:+ start:9178 stop:9870 length:693 start_codon:yes stop_codon:yes gene_type:complete